MVAPFYERRKKMNPYINKLLFAAIAIAALLTIQVFASSASAAGPSLGFPPGKPYYGSSNQRASRSFTRSRPMYRSTAPVIVRTERAPSAVAQAPTEERRFSYEPSQQVEAGTPCPQGVIVTPARGRSRFALAHASPIKPRAPICHAATALFFQLSPTAPASRARHKATSSTAR